VEEKKGTMITASNGTQIVTRNSSQFKLIPNNLAQSKEDHGKKDEEKTPGMHQNPPETKEDILLRRSKRQIKPPVTFSDYVQVIYVK